MLAARDVQLQEVVWGNTFLQTNAAEHLLEKINARHANVAIIGLGYVGLPLAIAFAEAGHSITGIDINHKLVDQLNSGHSTVGDVPSERLQMLLPKKPVMHASQFGGVRSEVQDQQSNSKNGSGNYSTQNDSVSNEIDDADLEDETFKQNALGSFRASTDYDVLFDMDAVIICVPTPLGSTKDPDMSYIITAADEIARRLHSGMLVVLESTTYPGTTEEIVFPRLDRVKIERAQLEVGTDYFLAFSPERIDPGRKDWTVQTTPKVIGGITPRCLEVARALYETAIECIVPVSKTTTAEMVKLLENTFRAVNIAMINEVAIMCDRLDVDVWEVIEAAKTKPFGYMPFYPGPGLGGHCIPIDPRYLAWKMKTLNYNARFIQLAEEINFGMPHYVLNKIIDTLNKVGKPLKDAHVLILGVTYKPDMGDLRESPALDLIRLLFSKEAAVAFSDPFVPRIVVDGRSLGNVELTEDVLQMADCVVITTAHSSFDWGWIIENCRLIVDTRNVTAGFETTTRIVKL